MLSKNHLRTSLIACFLLVTGTFAFAQEKNKVTVTGSVQSDMLVPTEPINSGNGMINNDFLTNTYVDANLRSNHIDAGVRFEYMQQPMPGFEPNFKGWGVPYGYVKYHDKKLEATAGTFYEQFGSGFILRTYEERSLGIDNSLLGAKVVLKPIEGVQLKALSGVQRTYWRWEKNLISGADLEIGLEQFIKRMKEHNTYLTLGASWVHKHEKEELIMVDATHKLNLPAGGNSMAFRARLKTGGLNILAEYSVKGQDPNYDNKYIYKQGNVAMLSASYSQKGLSALIQAKRSDNMTFRSQRKVHGTAAYLNHLPAFTYQHTYALAALYPYATNPNGEWAYQAEFGYKFKKGTALGGKYGTSFKVNFSHIRALDTTPVDGGGKGTDGYTSSFFGQGKETYYQDINVQFDKKFTKVFKLNLMYMNQRYNKTVVEGEGGMINSHIFVAEGKFQFNKTLTLRAEAQYLTTKQDEGDWAFALLELSIAPRWMISVQDMYNVTATHKHYYQGSVTFSHKAHRVQLGFGQTRAGYNCSGGVCRYIPAYKGVTLSYNFNF